MTASYLLTPPTGRRAVISEIIEFNEADLRRTIDFELAREGQVFVVSPKIKIIEMINQTLRNIYPEQSIMSVHGKMPQSTIDEALREFRNGNTKIITATTIIENGINIPNANTMIMVHQISFGTSTLSQLRGRIGRSDKQAYCYIALDPNAPEISFETKNRFQDFMHNSHLGSDIELALNDLERRGGGSILCAKQTGKSYEEVKMYHEPDPFLALDDFVFPIPPHGLTEEEFFQKLIEEDHVSNS